MGSSVVLYFSSSTMAFKGIVSQCLWLYRAGKHRKRADYTLMQVVTFRFLSAFTMRNSSMTLRRVQSPRPKLGTAAIATAIPSSGHAADRPSLLLDGRASHARGSPLTRGKSLKSCHCLKSHRTFSAVKAVITPPRFLTPALTSRSPSLMDTMPQCCLPLARLLTTSDQVPSRSHNRQSRTRTYTEPLRVRSSSVLAAR